MTDPNASAMGTLLAALGRTGGRTARAMRRRPSPGRGSDRVRLVILVNTLAPYGAETFVLNHATHANRDRFEVTVCYFGGSDALASRLRSAGASVECLDGRRSPMAIARLVGLLRRRRIDVLQTHVTYAGIVGRPAGIAAGVPVIVSTEQNMRDELPAAWGHASDLTMRLADRNVFISQAVARSFGRVFPELLTDGSPVITNGIDTRAIAMMAREARPAIRAELGLAPNDLAFVQVGRLNPVKGHRFSIQAFARVHARLPRTSLWIVGGGDLESELRTLAQGEGVGQAVHFLGQRMDVHRLLGGMDALVHPSRHEALGVAVLEAMAAGLPILASAVDGIPELVRDASTGWLHTFGDVETLAAHMNEVALDAAQARKVGAAACAFAQKEHDIKGSVAAYEALYLGLLDRT